MTTAALESVSLRLVLLSAWLAFTLPVSRMLVADPTALVGNGAGWSITATAILRLTTRGSAHGSSRALVALLGTLASTLLMLWRHPFGALLWLGALTATLSARAALARDRGAICLDRPDMPAPNPGHTR